MNKNIEIEDIFFNLNPTLIFQAFPEMICAQTFELKRKARRVIFLKYFM